MTSLSSIIADPRPRDSLGCSLERLDEDRRIDGGNMTFHRKRSASAPPGRVSTPATGHGYLIGLSVSGGHRRRIFRERHSTVHDFEENSIYVRSFSDSYQADLRGSFDFMLLEVSHSALERIADGADVKGVTELHAIAERSDPVLGGMLAALFATVDGRADRSALFVDQLSVAIGIHIVQQYGNARAVMTGRGRTLSSRSQAMLRELAQSRLSGDLTIEELAEACQLSQATFLRAFRETLGKTPHQWLSQQRIDKASHLLQFTETPLREIATVCGFSDQSHFTRAFVQATGTTPGVWRRHRKS
ncbi:HTH-type transcriptional activator RhaR [Ensifer psoraleae]|uniref:AraC family transcriptional regulator n=1 Tax=Sinorhizobium psoraleae TaxID=520838 RepID=UPI0015691BAA|nr:AraC family transcriptional regulator [Sinorhizobium psoraleae]NRP74704.1 HTH-type transcriptional activator RhaR [Sinorhizobium psoraleae]